MNNPKLLEDCYKKYMGSIREWLPDGMVDVDLKVLHDLGVLHYSTTQTASPITSHFHIIESSEKLTLANDTFVIWIVPQKNAEGPVTDVLIALRKPRSLKLEIGFSTKGIYNNSQLILQLLEKFLEDIQSTENSIQNLR